MLLVEEKHYILARKVHLYRRNEGDNWHCATFFKGRMHRKGTKLDSLASAKAFAEDWYFNLRALAKQSTNTESQPAPTTKTKKAGKLFTEAADKYLAEYDILTGGERNRVYVSRNKRRIEIYLNPFFGEMPLSEITSSKVQEYRIFRQTIGANGKPPAKSTLHQEIVTLRQILKTAIRHGWLSALPDMSTPYRTAEKISHRAWFSPAEYKQLYTATRDRARAYQGKRWQHQAEQLHDYVLFMANTGLRPDEANRLQYRDVSIEYDEDFDEDILVIEVRGKRGVGYCKSTNGAVHPFERLVKRNAPHPSDPIFSSNMLTIFNNVLEEQGLKFDREGNRRTAYSLRHTYICLRLMEGADIYQISKNCRTSVEMIEVYYASHIKNSIRTASVNVRTPKKQRVRTFTN